MLEVIHGKFYAGVMIVGEPDYLSSIDKMAIGSNGAASIEYLERLPASRVISINDTIKAVAEELKNGK